MGFKFVCTFVGQQIEVTANSWYHAAQKAIIELKVPMSQRNQLTVTPKD